MANPNTTPVQKSGTSQDYLEYLIKDGVFSQNDAYLLLVDIDRCDKEDPQNGVCDAYYAPEDIQTLGNVLQGTGAMINMTYDEEAIPYIQTTLPRDHQPLAALYGYSQQWQEMAALDKRFAGEYLDLKLRAEKARAEAMRFEAEVNQQRAEEFRQLDAGIRAQPDAVKEAVTAGKDLNGVIGNLEELGVVSPGPSKSQIMQEKSEAYWEEHKRLNIAAAEQIMKSRIEEKHGK